MCTVADVAVVLSGKVYVSPWQMEAEAVLEYVGFTVTAAIALLIQPFIPVPVTVYVVVEFGEAIASAAIGGSDHLSKRSATVKVVAVKKFWN